jgi:hypothetical protein
MTHRYFLWSASEGCHLFADEAAKNQKEDWFTEFKSLIGDLPSKDQLNLTAKREEISAIKTRLIELVHCLLSKRENMMLLCG